MKKPVSMHEKVRKLDEVARLGVIWCFRKGFSMNGWTCFKAYLPGSDPLKVKVVLLEALEAEAKEGYSVERRDLDSNYERVVALN